MLNGHPGKGEVVGGKNLNESLSSFPSCFWLIPFSMVGGDGSYAERYTGGSRKART